MGLIFSADSRECSLWLSGTTAAAHYCWPETGWAGFTNQYNPPERYRALCRLAAKHRLPAIGGIAIYPDSGGLVSYGSNRIDSYRRAADLVDKILKGAKPADLPVEQPTKFDLVVIVAKALGLDVPPTLLRAPTR